VYRVAKRHRMPYLSRSFSAKEPYNYWLFLGNRPASYGIPGLFLQKNHISIGSFAKEPYEYWFFLGNRPARYGILCILATL